MHEFDRCVIADSSEHPLGKGFVRSFLDGEMEVGLEKDISRQLRRGQRLRLYIYNDCMGECIYRGTVSSCAVLRLHLRAVTLLGNLQKRDNTRVNVELSYLIRFYVDEKGKHAFENPVHATILNVSAKGVYLSCRERFDIGFQFSFIFREASREIPVTAEIVRREENAGGFRYGCCFVGLPEADADEIHRFVFQKQIEEKRKQEF